jgi:hypothetical protein
VVVVVEEDIVCLLMTSKSSVGKRRHSIWTSLGTLHIPRILFWCNSVEGNSCILPEFFINLAGASAKFDSSGIPGIAQILPESGRNQWRTIKTSQLFPASNCSTEALHFNFSPLNHSLHCWTVLISLALCLSLLK